MSVAHAHATSPSEMIERQSLSRFHLVTITLCILVAVLDGSDTQCIGLVTIAAAALNQMIEFGRPNYVRVA
jgi:hypothetical protein